MNDQRDHGLQPLNQLMCDADLKPADLVRASANQLTHKMVTRAMKGRRLTRNSMAKVTAAFNLLSEDAVTERQLFNYLPAPLRERRGEEGAL